VKGRIFLKFRARIEIGLKKDHLDPESETVKRTLQDLNFPVTGVRTRKVYEITVDSGTKKDAEAAARAMCLRLLVNPTKDEFEIEVDPVGSTAGTEA
jgi:phosphoribosylformylglycinamidine synthase subunit PurS